MKSKDIALQTNNTELSKRKKNIEGVLEQEKGKLTSYEQVLFFFNIKNVFIFFLMLQFNFICLLSFIGSR